MKRLLLYLALLVSASTAFAQTTTITALPAGSTLLGTETIPMDQTGCGSGAGTCKTTPAAINTYVQAQTTPITGLPAATAVNGANDLLPMYSNADAQTEKVHPDQLMSVLSGDCTVSATTGVITCTKTSGTAFGAFATADPTAPPAIGGTTPAAGSFS